MTDHAGADDDAGRLLEYLRGLGATDDDMAAAGPSGLGPLALDLVLRAGAAAEPLTDFSARTGLDDSALRELWTALGFPATSRFPFPVTADIGEALAVLSALREALGDDPVLDFARVVGSSVARMADALSATTRVSVELPQRAAGTPYSSIVEEYCTQARDLLPVLLDVFAAVFRRHLVLVSHQLWSWDEARSAVTVERTVGFADLVGSTDVVRTASVAELAQHVSSFERLVWDVVASAGGRVVKLIGDEAMFVLDDPVTAVAVVAEIFARSEHPLRAGLDHGEVVALGGDYYGPTVNLAARLVAMAPAGTMLVSERVHDTSGAHGERLEVDLRGFPDTPAFVVCA